MDSLELPKDDDESLLADLLPGLSFNTFNELESTISEYSRYHRFYLSRNTSYFSTSKSMEYFNQVKIIQRGRFYCNYKTKEDKTSRTIKTSCTFIVAFTYSSTKRKYVLKQTPFQLSHNHECTERNSMTQNTQMVCLERDLTKEEHEVLVKYSPYYSMNQMKEIMRLQFGSNRKYEPNLMGRILKKNKDARYRKDMEEHPLYVPEVVDLSTSNHHHGDDDDVLLPAVEEEETLSEKVRKMPTCPNSAVGCSSYHQIPYPSHEITRYAKLRERCDRLILHALHNEHYYRLLCLNIKDGEAQLLHDSGMYASENEGVGCVEDLESVVDDTRRYKRVRETSIVDHELEEMTSSLETDKETCLLCKRHGASVIYDHETGSSKCPYAGMETLELI